MKVDQYEPSQHTRSPNPASDDTFYPDAIKKYTYRDIWIYHGEELIDEFLKLAIVLELQTMTDSKIVKSPSQSKVYIGSDKRGSVDLVINKLDNIAKYIVSEISRYSLSLTILKLITCAVNICLAASYFLYRRGRIVQVYPQSLSRDQEEIPRNYSP